MIEATSVSDTRREYAVLGSTGNVYNVVISHRCTCSCPDRYRPCKHLLFVMLKVLRVHSNSYIVYQTALLSSELKKIFRSAPRTMIGVLANEAVREHYERVVHGGEGEEGGGGGEEEGKGEVEKAEIVERKSMQGADCAICMEEFEESGEEEVVWCQAQCGQNVHKECLGMFHRSQHGQKTCVYCRAPWVEGKADATQGVKPKPRPTSPNGYEYRDEGYLNLGQEQGLSGRRDTSTYHWGWHRYGAHGRSWW